MNIPRGGQTHIKVAAYHEAGHALAALHEGRQVRGIFVSATRPGYGFCLSATRKNNPYNLKTNQGTAKVAWHHTVDSICADIRIRLAGPLAEAKALGKPFQSLGSQSDLDRCICLAERLAHFSVFINDYTTIVHLNPNQILQTEKQRIRRWLSRPNIWFTVSLVADILSKYGRLSSSNMNYIIGRAMSPRWQKHLKFGLARHVEG